MVLLLEWMIKVCKAQKILHFPCASFLKIFYLKKNTCTQFQKSDNMEIL